MSKSAQQILPDPSMWELIIDFARSRIDEQKNESNLIKSRKKYEEDLNRMGDGPKMAATVEYQTTAVAYARTLRAIESCRSQIKYYADQLGECIERAAQGKLFETGEVDALRKGAKNVKTGLFQDVIDKAEDIAEEEEVASARAAQEKQDAKGHRPDPFALIIQKSKETGQDPAWFKTTIAGSMVRMTDPELEALRAVHITNMADLFDFVHVKGLKLSTVDGLSKETASSLMSFMAHKASPDRGDDAGQAAATPAKKPGAKGGPKGGKPKGKKGGKK